MAKDKTVEEIYQKKTPLQHILLRPDTYIGTVEPSKEAKWILPKNDTRFSYKEITYTPGFYKIFDEVLVNAADNYQRDSKMTVLKVNIDAERGSITVHNNGKGIPIVIHKQHKIFVPELIFGHLLTGSNYNDDQRRVVGGRNGYGAKLANVFSNKFIVECGDFETGKKFKMTWRKNMSMHDQPQIQSYSGKDFVSVTFFPCFQKFNMPNGLDEDILALLHKRVYDMAGIMPRVKVSLNGDEIDVKSFSEYVDLYFQRDSSPTKIFDKTVNGKRWEVIISVSQGQFRQVSFVNSVCTHKGGTHVNYIIDQITDRVQEKIKRKQKNLVIKPFQIKAHIWIFINCLVENPTFDTQTKQTLTLKQSQFGSKCELSENMIKQFLKLGIVDTVIGLAKAKELTKLAKQTAGTKKSKLTGIPKLEDANDAGTRNSQQCTLILTEGDSAKSLAMSGLAVIGRDHYGVFPLKGKLLNVRQANNKTLGNNQEIQNLLKILGLSIGKKYQDLKSLRYGSIMIMSDQDTDGSHIKGLVINFIHHFWPSLFKIDGFIKQFITPLLKVTKGQQSISFYTMKAYKDWSEQIQNLKLWRIKYYKGLGTSTDKQARQYFQDLRKHKIDFKYVDQGDDEAMELIFSRKKIQERKIWLGTYDPNQAMIYDRPKVRYKQFVDRQFIHFSNQDNTRSIASLIDGFKPGQRKILYGCFKRNLVNQIKVAQLAGYISQTSAYHHGQMSLVETIVGMAQNYVGSNNVHLLMPNGQFGSRNLGGKDHASARYIFTNLSPVARYIFPEPDDHTLNYIEDDGQMVEPQHYIPIIPMLLVNGCQGIGTGWSTTIPNFNPREIAQVIKHKLRTGQQFRDIHPWYKNFTGQIEQSESGTSYQIYGRLQVDDSKENTVIISELPVGKWNKDFKLGLDQIMAEGDTKIVGLRQYHTKDTVRFQVEMNQNYFDHIYDQGDGDTARLEKYFKISNSYSMKNMVGFNNEGKLQRMPDAKSILNYFYILREQCYEKRKEYLKSRLVRDMVLLQQKEKFILQVVEQTIKIRNVKRIAICKTLSDKHYIKFSNLPKVKSTKVVPKQKKPRAEQDQAQAEQSDEQTQQSNIDAKQYNYLLEMPLWNLTHEKVEDIKAKCKSKKQELRILEKTTISEMWISDIDNFLEVLEKVEEKEKIDRKKEDQQLQKNLGKGRGQRAVKRKVKNQKKQNKPKKNMFDSDSQASVQTKQTAFGEVKIKKAKQQKPKQPQVKKERSKQKKQKDSQSQPDDFFARIKKRAQQAGSTQLVQRQIPQKGLPLLGQQKIYKFEQISLNRETRKRPSNKKKMIVDSDSDGQDKWSEKNLSEDDDDSDVEFN